MNENKSVNQKCMENILCHLIKLIVLTEPGETKKLKKLVKMSTSVSAQLLGVCREQNLDIDYDDNNEENFKTSLDEAEEYTK